MNNTKKLFFANMSYRLTTKEQRELFEQYGRVFEFRHVFDYSGNPRGFGFLTMDETGAARAIKELNNNRINGRWLHVRYEDEERTQEEKV